MDITIAHSGNGEAHKLRLEFSDGTPVVAGVVVTDFRGDKAIVVGWTEPKHDGSTGRVQVMQFGCDGVREYYPHVFNLKWNGGNR